MNLIWVCIIGYLIGSISTSVIISRLVLQDDIRQHGSGNPGGSNMIRTFGMKYGLLVLFLDAMKGLAAVLIGRYFVGEQAVYYCALAAVIGHNWSIFLKFKGGKGVATTVGAMLGIVPWATLIAIVVFLIVIFTTRYFSLGSLATLITIWLIILIRHFSNVELFMTSTLLTVLSIYQHRQNIVRLKNGTENRLNL